MKNPLSQPTLSLLWECNFAVRNGGEWFRVWTWGGVATGVGVWGRKIVGFQGSAKPHPGFHFFAVGGRGGAGIRVEDCWV